MQNQKSLQNIICITSSPEASDRIAHLINIGAVSTLNSDDFPIYQTTTVWKGEQINVTFISSDRPFSSYLYCSEPKLNIKKQESQAKKLLTAKVKQQLDYREAQRYEMFDSACFSVKTMIFFQEFSRINICDDIDRVFGKHRITRTLLYAPFNSITKDSVEMVFQDAEKALPVNGVLASRFVGELLFRFSALVSFGRTYIDFIDFCYLYDIFNRYVERKIFQPENFYYLGCRIGEIEGTWKRPVLFDKLITFVLYSQISGQTTATVEKYNSISLKKRRPFGLCSSTLLSKGSKYLGLPVDVIWLAAQELYTLGLITCPETDCDCYPIDAPIIDIMRSISLIEQYRPYIQKIRNHLQKPIRGLYQSQYQTPIYPVDIPKPEQLADEKGYKKLVYDFIVRYFLATVSPDAQYQVSTATVSVGQESFSFKSKVLTNNGFYEILNYKQFQNQPLPEFHEGETIDVSIEFRQSTTAPPKNPTVADYIKSGYKKQIWGGYRIFESIRRLYGSGFISSTLNPTKDGATIAAGFLRAGLDCFEPEKILTDVWNTEKKLLSEGGKPEDEVQRIASTYGEQFKELNPKGFQEAADFYK